MKHILSCVILLTLLGTTACNSKKGASEDTVSDTTTVDSLFLLDTLRGIYMGDFGGSDIRVVINYVSENHAVGYNLHKGLQRNLTGKTKMNANSVDFELAEPGDNPYDGVFKFSIDKKTFVATGSWKPNNSKLSARTFTLKKLDTRYKEDESDRPEITAENFSRYMYEASDSIGTITFEEDGRCLYTYYPSTDDVERREQLIEIKGSWSLKDNHVVIEWKKNTVFPSGKSYFELIHEEDYGYMLQGEGRKLAPMYY